MNIEHFEHFKVEINKKEKTKWKFADGSIWYFRFRSPPFNFFHIE